MPDKFFFETEKDSQREFYKIFIFLGVVATAVAGILFYFVYTDNISKDPVFVEARCGFAESDRVKISGSASDASGMKAIIERSVGAGAGSLYYQSLRPTSQCDNDVGMWFNNRDGSVMYAYCLGRTSGDLIKFERIDCSDINHTKAISDSIDALAEATGSEKQ